MESGKTRDCVSDQSLIRYNRKTCPVMIFLFLFFLSMEEKPVFKLERENKHQKGKKKNKPKNLREKRESNLHKNVKP